MYRLFSMIRHLWANRVRERFWRVVHNVVAHPLIEILPERYGTAFHDWTADRMGPHDTQDPVG